MKINILPWANFRAAGLRGALRLFFALIGFPLCAQPTTLPVAPIFTKVENSPVVTTAGDSRSVNWIDIDNDNDLDLFITNGPKDGENNMLYKNNGKGVFTAVANDPIVQDGKPSDGATWADFDNDGDLDCFVANWWFVESLLYANDGAGNFTQMSGLNLVTQKSYSETASWGDYDNDGWVDLYVANSYNDKRNFLYRNLGNGTFAKITSGAMVTDLGTSRCVNWTDYDNDGDVDLFITNEEDENENLYRNQGNGTFSKLTTGPLVQDGGKTMSASWGDYDNDGDQDVFLANDKGNDGLFRNDNGVFVKISGSPVTSSGGNSFGSQWADIDNDGDLDLFVTNAFGTGKLRNFLFLNQGGGVFVRDQTEVVSQDMGWSYGAAFGDMDADGDLDLAVANCFDASQTDYLYENHASENLNHWLTASCVGVLSNRSAIGAKVRLKATIGGKQVTQLREISAQTGYCGQNQLAAHFGLGDATSIESLEVQWPSGIEELFGNIAVNQHIVLTEGQGVSDLKQPTGIPGLHLRLPAPNPFHDNLSFGFDLDQASDWKIDILDNAGRTVCPLHNGRLEAGTHTFQWAGNDAGGTAAPAGTYRIAIYDSSGRSAGQSVVKY